MKICLMKSESVMSCPSVDIYTTTILMLQKVH